MQVDGYEVDATDLGHVTPEEIRRLEREAYVWKCRAENLRAAVDTVCDSATADRVVDWSRRPEPVPGQQPDPDLIGPWTDPIHYDWPTR